MTRHYIEGVERRPFSTATKKMSKEDRLEWFRLSAEGRPRKRGRQTLSYILRKALRQEWGLGA
jgi:hypothetical protein